MYKNLSTWRLTSPDVWRFRNKLIRGRCPGYFRTGLFSNWPNVRWKVLAIYLQNKLISDKYWGNRFLLRESVILHVNYFIHSRTNHACSFIKFYIAGIEIVNTKQNYDDLNSNNVMISKYNITYIYMWIILGMCLMFITYEEILTFLDSS